MLNSMLKIFVGPVMGGGGLNPHQPPRQYATGMNSVGTESHKSYLDYQEFHILMMSAAVKRRKRRRVQHSRQIWTKPWLMDRNTDRGFSQFVNYELADDASGFYGFLRMPPDIVKELLSMETKCESVSRP
jgi:hypothetical protein